MRFRHLAFCLPLMMLASCVTHEPRSASWPPQGFRPIASTTVRQQDPFEIREFRERTITTSVTGFQSRALTAGIMTASAGPPVHVNRGRARVVRKGNRVYLVGGEAEFR